MGCGGGEIPGVGSEAAGAVVVVAQRFDAATGALEVVLTAALGRTNKEIAAETGPEVNRVGRSDGATPTKVWPGSRRSSRTSGN